MKVRVFCSYVLIAGGLTGVVLTVVLWVTAALPGSPLELIAGLVGLFLAFVLVRRVPENRMSFLLSLIAFTGATLNLTTPLVDLMLDRGQVVLTVLFTQWANAIFPILIVSLLVLLPLWFPTGRALSPGWEWVWRVSLLIAVPLYLAGFFAEKTCVDSPDGFDCLQYLETPWGMSGWNQDVFGPFFLLVFAMSIPAILSMVLRFQRAQGIERQQLRFFMLSTALLGFTFLANVVLVGLFGWQRQWFQSLFALVLTAALVSIAMAVLRYRLYDIDRIISRTVTYTIVVVVLGLVFALGVTAIPNVVIGTGSAPPLMVAASTLLVAAMFNPLRRRVQSRVDRRFNRSKYDGQRVLDEFASSLRDQVDSETVVGGWLGVVSETMQPAAVGVWMREPSSAESPGARETYREIPTVVRSSKSRR